jgi:hypothetical protein
MTPEFELDDKVLKALDAVYAAPGEPATKQAQVNLRRALMAAKGRIVYYGYVPKTRVGPLFVAVSDRGLVALDFGLSEQEFVARVSQRTKATLIRSDDEAAEALKQVQEYLDGQRTTFDLPLDMNSMSEFQRVEDSARQISNLRGCRQSDREAASFARGGSGAGAQSGAHRDSVPSRAGIGWIAARVFGRRRHSHEEMAAAIRRRYFAAMK